MALSGSFKTSNYEGRHYVLSWTATQSIADNTSSIKWTLTATGGSASWYAERTLQVVVAGQTVINKTDRVERYAGTVGSGIVVINHNTDGSKSFSASIRAAVYRTSVNCTGSGSWELDDIPRQAEITSAPNFDDEDNPIITYSNPAGKAVDTLQACISLDGSAAEIAYRDISKTGTSYTFNLTTAERNVLRNATTTANTRKVRFYVATTIGGTTYRNYLEKTLTIVNAEPTLSPTAVDNGSVSKVLTGDAENKVIKYYNSMLVDIGAAAKKGATLKSYKITNGGKSITTASGKLSNVESGSFTFSATDSRGNTTTKTINKTLINYVKLTCNLAVNAPTTDGDMTLTISGNYFNGSFGAVANALTVQYRVKANNGSYGSWTAATASLKDNKYTATVNLSGLDYRSTYTIQARAGDLIYNGDTEPYIESPAKTVKTMPVFDWGSDDFKFNVPVHMANAQQIYGTDTDGNSRILVSLNASNQAFFGFGLYESGLGTTYFDGNAVSIRSKGNINNTAAGTIGGNKAWTNSSDSRLKTDIADIPDVFSRIWFELMPKMFRWSDINGNDGKHHFGLIAQDVIEVFGKYGLNYEEYGFVSTIPIDDIEYYAITYEYYNILTAFVLRQAIMRIEALEQKLQGE